MLELDSPRWAQLRSAYGPATEIPDLLSRLEGFPPADGHDAEPYFSLWSALCHQGDVYTASYAALPHIVSEIDCSGKFPPWTLFLLVACIEIARENGRGPAIPDDLKAAYAFALGRIPILINMVARQPWDETYCRAALAALAAAKGLHKIAEALTELDPDTIAAKLEQKFGR
jgi:hypothetical protein